MLYELGIKIHYVYNWFIKERIVGVICTMGKTKNETENRERVRKGLGAISVRDMKRGINTYEMYIKRWWKKDYCVSYADNPWSMRIWEIINVRYNAYKK